MGRGIQEKLRTPRFLIGQRSCRLDHHDRLTRHHLKPVRGEHYPPFMGFGQLHSGEAGRKVADREVRLQGSGKAAVPERGP